MNPSHRRNKGTHLAPVALAIALALSGVTASADSTDSGSSPGFMGSVKSYSANAWHKTKDFFTPKPGAAMPNDAQRYGRAGGYVGADQIAFLHSNLAPTTAGQDAVKTGDTGMDYESTHLSQAPAATTNGDTSMAPEERNGRTEGSRFDHSDGTHGQDETR